MRTLTEVENDVFYFFASVFSIVDVVADCTATNQDSRLFVLWTVMGVTTVNVTVILNANRRDSGNMGYRICSYQSLAQSRREQGFLV